jgi:hypothetical protein
MTASDSFRATIGFSILALAGLLFGNLASALIGLSGWAAFGVLASLLSIGCAYGSQLFTTNGLSADEMVPRAQSQTDVQTLREAAAFAHNWGRQLQLSSLGTAIVAGIFLVVSLP